MTSIDEARSAIRADYYTDIRALARDAIAEIAAGTIDGREGLDRWIEESADGSERVIYCGKAIETLLASDRWTAIDDSGLEPVADPNGLSGVVCHAAYFAICEDLREDIARLTQCRTLKGGNPLGLPEDFDLDDDDTWPANRTDDENEGGRMSSESFVPRYSPWRHGGWYVTNVQYPSGAVGCVSRNYPDKRWRIVCDPRGRMQDHTYPSRDAAARAERDLALAMTAGVTGTHNRTAKGDCNGD